MEETAPLKAPFEAQGKQGAAPAPSEVTHASVSPRDGDGRKATSSPGNSRPLTETMMPISGRRTVFRFGRSAAAFSAAAFGFVFLPGRQPFRRDGTFQQLYAYLRESAQKRVIARSATKALPNRIQPNVPGDAAGCI